jgi:hypothetical protein
LAHTWLELGHYGQAIRLARQGVKQTHQVGHPVMGGLARSTWGAIQLSDLLVESTRQGLTVILDWALSELCALHALAGDWGQAYGYARKKLEFRGDESLLPIALTGWYEISIRLYPK